MPLKTFKHKYYELLKGYFEDQDERFLFEIEGLGRAMVLENIPPEDIAEVHEDAVFRLAEDYPDMKLVEYSHFLSPPLMEIMVSYGLAFREWFEISEKSRAELQKYTDELERKNRELEEYSRQLKQSKKQFSTFMDYLPAAASIKDQNMQPLYTNKYLKEEHYADERIGDTEAEEGVIEKIEAEVRKYDGNTTVEELVDLEGNKRFCRKTRFTINMDENTVLYGSLGIDVTEQKLAEEMMLKAKIAAEEANRTKSDFLANMSHELRTPLNSVIGFSEILLEQLPGPLNEKQVRYVHNISISGKRLLALITEVLDLSRVEAGKMDIKYENISVPESVTEVIEILSPLALEGKIDLGKSIDPRLLQINADGEKFKGILYNLISNAIKFTKEGGSVMVRGHTVGNMAEISVRDTGIGIAKEDQIKLFDPFTQLDSGASRKYQGSGLGLALTRKFVELHGGTIKVESEMGKGSNFTFTLPIS